MKIYIKKTLTAPFEPIDLPDKELGKGGQARVYTITTNGYQDYCVKIFIKLDDAQKNYGRIQYMIQNPPAGIMDNPGFRICWPTAYAFDTNHVFIGYVMPLAFPESRDLLILACADPRPISTSFKEFPAWHDKYELNEKKGVENRMKMLCNWAIAIHQIHSTDRYVITDMKPQNVMATATGKISVVDTDSFQISEKGKVLFPAAAFTPDYFPPEGASLYLSNQALPITCDYFAAAVVFYLILVGINPYAGTICRGPYEEMNTIDDCIREGLFAYGSKRQFISFPKNGLNLHDNFNNIPSEIQRLFIRAFDSDINNRSNLAEWGQAFKRAIETDAVQIRSVINVVKTNSPAIKITGVSFANQDGQGQSVQNFGQPLFTDVLYLTPRIQYQVLRQGSSVEIWYKVHDPHGNVLVNSSSAHGLTWKGIADCSASSGTAVLGGWGNDKKTAYTIPGVWKIDFYEGNTCLYKSTLTISDKTPAAVTPKTPPPATPRQNTPPVSPPVTPPTTSATSSSTTSTTTGGTKPTGKLGYVWKGVLLLAVIWGAFQLWNKMKNTDGADQVTTTTSVPASQEASEPSGSSSGTASTSEPAASQANSPSASQQVATASEPITVKQISFGNFDSEGNVINEFGSMLHASTLQYLKGLMYYVPNRGSTSLVLYFKLFRPNGKLISASRSPEGYTISQKFDTPSQTGETASLVLPGWGNKKGTVYSPGTYRYEIWYDNKLLYKTHVQIN